MDTQASVWQWQARGMGGVTCNETKGLVPKCRAACSVIPPLFGKPADPQYASPLWRWTQITG